MTAYFTFHDEGCSVSFIEELFGKSPFGPLAEHSQKVTECVEVIRPRKNVTLSGITNEPENTGDMLRTMLVQ